MFHNYPALSRLLLVPMVLAAALGASAADAPAKKLDLSVTFGDQGPSSLKYMDVELIASAAPSLSAATTDANGKSINVNLGKSPRTSVDGKTFTRACDGLTVVTAWAEEGPSLRMTVTFRNTGEVALTRVAYMPLVLKFPSRPLGGSWKWGYRVTKDNRGVPGVVDADYRMGKVVACNDEIEKAVTFGFEGNYGNSSTNGIIIETVKGDTIAPGKEKTFRFSLRFAASGTPTDKIAADIYKQFAAAYPFKLNWPDRRPIGALMACQSAKNWPTNPRGWLNDPKIDITTEEGKKAFRQQMLKWADTAVATIKETGGQGMIFWSVEGEQMPHAITYLGDPRVLPQSAPEMDEIADEVFKKFADANLKTGVCIRPSRIIADGKGGWKHLQVADHISEMADKIAYAKKRWGCTIFYMDTNVKWERGMWQGDASLLAAADLYELTKRHPDVLIFPEFGTFGYWSCCMPYGELRGGSDKTSDLTRAVYPKCGSTITIADGDMMAHYENLLSGVLAGDILLFRGWFGDPANADVKRIYQEAEYVRKAASAPAAGAIDKALADTDPAVRYQALVRAKPTDKAAMAEVIKAAGGEKNWVVLKKMIALMGESADPAAIETLTKVLKDKGLKLGHFAARALGKFGPTASPTLIAMLTEADTTLVAGALQTLATYEEPNALGAILPLADSNTSAIRLAAIKALGSQRDEASVDKLISLLDANDAPTVSAAATALGKIKDPRSIKPLVEAINRVVARKYDNNVRVTIGDALEAVTGKQFGPYEAQWRKTLDSGKLAPQQDAGKQ